jgi:hypothetical protein
MRLDQVMSSSDTMVEQLAGLMPDARDEFAYVVLVGLVGEVPRTRVPGEFKVGQLRLRYKWLSEEPIDARILAQSEDLKLVLVDGVLSPESFSMSIGAVLELWEFVQAHSDAIAFWPSSERHRWISDTAKAFATNEDFVRNLATNYPQLRRLCS